MLKRKGGQKDSTGKLKRIKTISSTKNDYSELELPITLNAKNALNESGSYPNLNMTKMNEEHSKAVEKKCEQSGIKKSNLDEAIYEELLGNQENIYEEVKDE